MKLALFADVHANLEALTACLEHARAGGADAFAFAGDLVGYGADPEAVLDVVAGLAADGAVVVRGNHDAAVLERGAGSMHHTAEEALAWTRDRLGAQHRAFLEKLPLVARRGDALVVHANAERPTEWSYVTDPIRAAQSLDASDGANWVFCGHVHEPILYSAAAGERPAPFHPVPGTPIPVSRRCRWLAVLGSVGQPRDGNTAACYAVWDEARERLTFERVPYDVSAAAAKVRAAGLPDRLAYRLERGQ
jgi:diadenosine tetraphosphatase ApaH/serine/threonine PP2A family protein phosphatase